MAPLPRFTTFWFLWFAKVFAVTHNHKLETPKLFEHSSTPFSTKKLVWYERTGSDYQACNCPKLYIKSNAILLALHSSGSDILTGWSSKLQLPAQRNYACTLVDLYQRGARRVLMAIRDPTARIILGYQTIQRYEPIHPKIDVCPTNLEPIATIAFNDIYSLQQIASIE